MNSKKSKYIYPELNGHRVLYKGKRFWVFEISSDFPFNGMEEFCQIIVYDKEYGCEIAGAESSGNGYYGSLIGPQDSVEVSGDSPAELVDSVIRASRNYEKHFAGYISPSTPRVRKRVAKSKILFTSPKNSLE
jgi:hypothetical protein